MRSQSMRFAVSLTDRQVASLLSSCYFADGTERHVCQLSIKVRHRLVGAMAHSQTMESGTEARRFQL